MYEYGVTHSYHNQTTKQPDNQTTRQPNNQTTTRQQPDNNQTTKQPDNNQITIMARYEGSLSLGSLGYKEQDAGRVCGAIIGRGGQGVKALTTKFPGLYINVYDSRHGKDARSAPRDCDTIHLTGRSTADVLAAAQEIARIAKDAMDGTLPEGPCSTVTCPPEAVGAVIGRGGSGLRTIQEKAGDNCYIHYSRESGLFKVSASTQAGCKRAKIYIGGAIRDFFQRDVVERPASRPKSSIRFDGLDIESEDELGDAVEEHKASAVLLTVHAAHDALEMASQSDSLSIHSRKSRETSKKDQWAIKEELAEKKDPVTGAALYPPFQCQFRGWVTGVNAVPWSAVEQELARRQTKQTDGINERAAKRAKFLDTKSREEQRHVVTSGLTNDALFPLLSSNTGQVAGASMWGSKPSSVSSGEGVAELNEAQRKLFHSRVPSRRKTKGPAVSGPVDLTHLMPSVSKSKMVDLSRLLPSGPKLSRSQGVDAFPTHRGSSDYDDEDEYNLDNGFDEPPMPIDDYGDDGDDWWNH